MARVLFFGDSITAGFWDVDGGGWAELLLRGLHAGTWASQKRRWVTAYNLGLSGDTSTGLLQRLGREATPRLDDDGRLLVVVAIGINDVHTQYCDAGLEAVAATYSGNLGRIHRCIADLGGRALYVGLTPVDEDAFDPGEQDHVRDRYRDADVARLDTELRGFCRHGGHALVPLREHFVAGDLRELLPDGLHPGTAGHQLIHRLVREPLLVAVGQLLGDT